MSGSKSTLLAPGLGAVALANRDFEAESSLWRMRPTFEFPIKEERTRAIQKMQDRFESGSTVDSLLMHGEYGEIHLPAEQHRLWSPHLSFYVSQQAGQTLIRGRFAPRIEVWTFVWVLYLAMGFGAFFGLALAYSQVMLGESPWGLWIAVGGLLGIPALYAVAHVGQHWSRDQMTQLRAQLDEWLESAEVQV